MTKFKNWFVYIWLSIFFIAGFSLCAKSKKETIRQRIVSLVPSVTEIIFALGKDSLLVGNTIYCDYPEAAKHIYKVGDFSNPSLERILRRKPSLVFATLPEQRNIIEQLKKHKIPVYVSQPKSVDSILSEIIEIGKLINANDTAKALVNFL
ncbi:MAG: helical backbone metal receptor, partial [candidate division WOR-3 bacterium]